MIYFTFKHLYSLVNKNYIYKNTILYHLFLYDIIFIHKKIIRIYAYIFYTNNFI
jgi:hypothetical protein